jgi:hypothetical protein
MHLSWKLLDAAFPKNFSSVKGVVWGTKEGKDA